MPPICIQICSISPMDVAPQPPDAPGPEHLVDMLPDACPVGVDRVLTVAMPGTYRLQREVVFSLPGLGWATFRRIGDPSCT